MYAEGVEHLGEVAAGRRCEDDVDDVGVGQPVVPKLLYVVLGDGCRIPGDERGELHHRPVGRVEGPQARIVDDRAHRSLVAHVVPQELRVRRQAVGGSLRARSRVREAEALTDPSGLGAFRVLEWRG